MVVLCLVQVVLFPCPLKSYVMFFSFLLDQLIDFILCWHLPAPPAPAHRHTHTRTALLQLP